MSPDSDPIANVWASLVGNRDNRLVENDADRGEPELAAIRTVRLETSDALRVFDRGYGRELDALAFRRAPESGITFSLLLARTLKGAGKC